MKHLERLTKKKAMQMALRSLSTVLEALEKENCEVTVSVDPGDDKAKVVQIDLYSCSISIICDITDDEAIYFRS